MAVKKFKLQKSWSLEQMKREVFYEARMICHLGDHRGLPLLFGVVTESVPLRLVTQVHGMKHQSITLRKGLNDNNNNFIYPGLKENRSVNQQRLIDWYKSVTST